MTLESSATMMDAIFASEGWESRGRLLKLLQEFLVSEAIKHAAVEKGKCFDDYTLFSRHGNCIIETLKNKVVGTKINMDELVGNTHGFAESGYVLLTKLTISVSHLTIVRHHRVSSTVVQRYLVQIQEAALSPQVQLHTTAVDILSFTIKQGLAHPLQVRFSFYSWMNMFF